MIQKRPKEERPWKSDHCEKDFYKEQDLELHSKIHITKVFKCNEWVEFCGSNFVGHIAIVRVTLPL